MYKNKELNWENDEFKVIKFDLERYEKMNRKHLYYIIECKHCHSQFSRKKEFLEKINKIYCNFKSSTTIPNGSISQANGDGNGENPKNRIKI